MQAAIIIVIMHQHGLQPELLLQPVSQAELQRRPGHQEERQHQPGNQAGLLRRPDSLADRLLLHVLQHRLRTGRQHQPGLLLHHPDQITLPDRPPGQWDQHPGLPMEEELPEAGDKAAEAVAGDADPLHCCKELIQKKEATHAG